MIRFAWMLLACLVIFLPGFCPAAQSAEIGQIKNMNNSVDILRGSQTIPAKAGTILLDQDTVITGADSDVGMIFIDNSKISLGPDSRLELTRFNFNPTTQEGEFSSGVSKGTLVVVSGEIAKSSPDAMQVRTRTSLISVRGTRFLVKVPEN